MPATPSSRPLVFPQMPNVFVIPPEEDHDPPFCCFDAAQPLERDEPTQADLEGPGSALDIISRITRNSSPAFCRDGSSSDVVMPMRTMDSRSFNHKVANEGEYEEFAPDITIREGTTPGDDSEIIEVVKVKRHNERGRSASFSIPPSSSDSSSKRAESFKSRASRAFNSIKNVGRSVSRSRKASESSDEAIPSSSTPEPLSRAPSPSLSRRKSLILTSIFSHTSSPNSQPSPDLSDEETLASPVSPATTSSVSLAAEIHTPSYEEMQDFIPSTDTEDEDDSEATPRAVRYAASVRSPSPTSGFSKSNRRRFSVLNLFSASKEMTPSQPSVVVSSSTPTLPALSQASLDRSTTDSSESSAPTTPVDDVFPSSRTGRSLLRRLPSFSKGPRHKSREPSPMPHHLSTSADRAAPKTVNTDPEPLIADNNELSFGEIRLDSLHFDELSFDANRF